MIPLLTFNENYEGQGFFLIRSHQEPLVNLKVGLEREEMIFLGVLRGQMCVILELLVSLLCTN